MIDHAVYISDLVGAEHIGLGLAFAIEDEEDYDYFGYDPRYYPRPPWTWPIGLGGFFRDAPNSRPRCSRAASLSTRYGASWARTSCVSSNRYGERASHLSIYVRTPEA